MSGINEFAEKVLSQFAAKITDEVFLTIEGDEGLMYEYLRLIDENSLDSVNRTIGKKVKERFSLENAELRQKLPKSKLIKSCQIFK